MGRDTIQLENAVSTISQEYLLVFTSEYDIPEGLHLELPGPEETTVDFPEGKVDMDLFNLISVPNPTKDEVAYKILPTGNESAMGVALETGLEKEVAAMGPPVNKRRHKRGNNEAEANAPPKVLRMDYDTFRPAQSTHGGKSLALIGLDAASLLSTPAAQDLSTATKSGTTTEIVTEDAATVEVNIQFSVGSLESRRSSSVPSMVGSPGSIYQPGWGVANDCRLDAPDACQYIVDPILPLSHGFSTKVECAEMDARLDKISVDFNEELYPNMLIAIAGRRWVIGYGLRLAVMKCAESLEIRQAFADVVSAGLAKDLWAVKEEMPLEDATAANISRAEKKKKCMVVCHTHGIGFAHPARSDGILVSSPTVPQGLATLLADAATQTETADQEEPHLRLKRSMSSFPVYDLY
nr:hypothetical protein [Tanacetum cinerariifolium]